MESFFILGLIIILAGPVLALIALSKIGDLQRNVARLKAQLENFNSEPIEKKPTVVAAVQKTVVEAIKEEVTPAIEAAVEIPNVSQKAVSPKRDMEGTLASRWFVWVGGAAVALGGLLFVKYAHDNGLIPPVLRVIIGLGFASALVAAGEWIRKSRAIAVQDYVPAALSAAGLAIAFGVIYAAYALYGLLSPGVCFPALVAVGLAALWLSLRQGPLVAALGLIGSYAAPILVPSDIPNPWGFFAYLLVIVVASLWVLRQRAWWWLGYAAVAGASLWALLWVYGGLFQASHAWPTGLFALALGGASVWVIKRGEILNADMGNLAQPKLLSQPMRIAIAGLAGMTLILAALVLGSAHATSALVLFSLGMMAITALGWLRDGNVGAPLAAALVTVLVMMAWPDVGFHAWAMDERGLWSTVPGLIEPPRFRNVMIAAMVIFTSIGLFGVFKKPEPKPWAILASFSAVVFVFGAWGRADFSWTWQLWTTIALVAAAVMSIVADRVKQHAARATDYLTAGIVLLLLFAIDRMFDGVWQTIVIAALAFKFAYLTTRIPSTWIAAISALLGTLAAARLFVGREFWGEPADLMWGSHWVLYGYGIPAVLAWLASRQITASNMGRYRTALEGIALGLVISLVSLEIRVLIGGGITRDRFDLLELSSHALAWLGAAYGLAYRQQIFSSFVSLWGARALLAASCLALFIGLTLRNPVITGDSIAGGTVINALWMAYLLPVPLLVLMARKTDALGLAKLRDALGVFTLALLVTFVTLWVKRLFEDSTLTSYFISDAQSWAVSAAWIATAIAIFIAGIKLDRQTIRYAGLAILVLAILKVFALDLFDLGGLWRIASVIGLGLCLIGVGWLYTRFVQSKSSVNINLTGV